VGRQETLTSQSLVERTRRQDPHRPVAQLFVVLSCDDPLGSPSRHLLDGVDIVQLRRGTAAHARRETAGSVEKLILEIPDPRMSQEHARLVAVRGSWVVEDAGSKNGTGLNGVVTTQAQLGDGDILEVGHTFLMFRDAVPAVCPEVPDLLADDIDEGTAGPATFVVALREQLEALVRVAATAVPVTFLGETGTGKEVAARALHALSRRRGKLVAVNCGAVPETLLEAELFGHRRGAFSGAVEDRLGLVRAAHHGTLLLDEIGELPAGSQVAFLRVLQEQEVVPVGGAEAVKVDVRLCVATNADLEALVAKGAFREDLYARLGGLVVRLPPLRDRREDLGLLIGAVLRRAGSRGRRGSPRQPCAGSSGMAGRATSASSSAASTPPRRWRRRRPSTWRTSPRCRARPARRTRGSRPS